MPACAFIPKTVSEPKYSESSCSTITSEWDIEVIAINDSGFACHDEACAIAIVAIPIITAAVTIPLVIVGNTINFVEKQFSCD